MDKTSTTSPGPIYQINTNSSIKVRAGVGSAVEQRLTVQCRVHQPFQWEAELRRLDATTRQAQVCCKRA